MSGTTRDEITLERDEENRKLSEAMGLLLAARDRVLTLSEQRVCLDFLALLYAYLTLSGDL